MSGFGIFRAISFRLGRVVVAGTSMQPTYNPKDWLLVRYRTSDGSRRAVNEGKVVVIEREVQPGVFYIKRISEIVSDEAGATSYFVSSDNAIGTDSRQWGYLRDDEVVATVIARIKGRYFN
jgi:phage repressor protein C with HTH and peptisase S24 domain